MKKAAKENRFEEAAELRNQLFGLKGLRNKIVFSDKEFMDISSDQALKQLQKLLKLENPPRRIEGYDISHHAGENTVGSMVVFTNGTADRAEYRKFKIRSSRNDDLKSMTEVITRRLKHKEWEFPDLIILDGGVAQVNAILPLVEPHGIPVIGRDKSGDHTRNARVRLVIPEYSELRGFRSAAARGLARSPRGDGRERRGPRKQYSTIL
jgi:excinuclease ABC subunit C